jgi:hypothetical protein
LLFDPGEQLHYRTSSDLIGRLVEVVAWTAPLNRKSRSSGSPY